VIKSSKAKLKLDIKIFSLLGIVCLLNTILCFSGAFLSWNDVEYLALGLISGLISCVFVYLCFKKLKSAKKQLLRLESQK
jgi:Na+/melibiose symporter-like transporter